MSTKIMLKTLKCFAPSSGGDDDTYAKFNVDGSDAGRWPATGDHDMGAGAEVYIGRQFEFHNNLTVQLWEYDSGSSDDFLGTCKFSAGTGKGKADIKNADEGDHYQLDYEYIKPEKKVKTVHLRSMKCICVSEGLNKALVASALNLSGKISEAVGSVLRASVDKKKPSPTKAIGAAFEKAGEILSEIPGLVEAINGTMNQPDQLYLSRSNREGRDARFWPSKNYRDGYYEIYNGRITRFDNVKLPLSDPIDIYMWEYDYGSKDDCLGSFSIEVDTKVGTYIKPVISAEHQSIYLVAYSVEE